MITAVLEALASTIGQENPGIEILTSPPDKLPDHRVFLLYEQPGASEPSQHTGRAGGIVAQNTDVFRIEYHYPIAQAPGDEVVGDARSRFDAMRLALWKDFRVSRFSRTARGLNGIRTDIYGPMEYGNSVSFGFRLELEIVHDLEA